MAPLVLSIGSVAMSVQNRKRLFTVDDCYRMSEAGILGPTERVELIWGELLEMSPTGPRHGAAVDGATRAFVRLAGDEAIVRVQGTVVLDQLAAPLPDVVLLRPRDDFYVRKNPAGADILLVVEVAESSLDYDTTVKTALYALLGVQEYWVADLQNDRLIIHLDPAGDAYKSVRTVERGARVAPQLLSACEISTDILLPETR
jgi:Uma2 family endonuclease